MSLLERDTVKKVRAALTEAGLVDMVLELEDTARSAEDAAQAIGTELGSIVKSLVFAIDQRMVMALVAGDHQCLEDNLPRCLDLEGAVRRPQASEVKGITGFTIGGVPPIGLAHRLPVAIDRSLKRFETVYAAAGHPHCVFPIAPADLIRVTEGLVSWNIAEPLEGVTVEQAGLKQSRSFTDGREKRATG